LQMPRLSSLSIQSWASSPTTAEVFTFASMLSRYPLHSVRLIIAGISLRHKYKIGADDKISKRKSTTPVQSLTSHHTKDRMTKERIVVVKQRGSDCERQAIDTGRCARHRI
jgi:hypothetical protein